MGSSSKSQTSTSSPWQPSVPGRQSAINSANSLMSGYGQSTSGGFDTGAPTTQQFVRREPNKPLDRSRGLPSFDAYHDVFDSEGYQAAVRNYNAARAAQAKPDPIYSALDELQRINDQGSPMEEAAYQYGTDVLGGKYLNAGNPYIQHMIDRSAQDVNAQFGMGGRYGSGAHAGRLMDQSMGLRYQNYGDERNWMNTMAGMAPTISALRYAPAQYGLSIAQARESVPWDRLSRYADTVNALSAGGGSQTVPIYNNKGAQIAGLGLTALGALAAPYTGGASLMAAGAIGSGLNNRTMY